MPAIRHQHTAAQKRQARIRAKLHGTASRPRLTIFRSNLHTHLQVIDDEANKTLVSLSDISKGNKFKGTKTERAIQVTAELIKLLTKAKIKAVVFDRGSYKYHGRVKAVAETLRQGKIKV